LPSEKRTPFWYSSKKTPKGKMVRASGLREGKVLKKEEEGRRREGEGGEKRRKERRKELRG
jgi:hypothetical protein